MVDQHPSTLLARVRLPVHALNKRHLCFELRVVNVQYHFKSVFHRKCLHSQRAKPSRSEIQDCPIFLPKRDRAHDFTALPDMSGWYKLSHCILRLTPRFRKCSLASGKFVLMCTQTHALQGLADTSLRRFRTTLKEDEERLLKTGSGGTASRAGLAPR